MQPYDVEDSTLAFAGRLSRVRVDKVRMPDGNVVQREIVEHPSAVAIVPVDDDDRIVLIRHYRPALRTRLTEIPAGKLDVDGEASLDAARRELAEEVGLVAGEWAELVHFANSSGWTDESTVVYLATKLSDVPDPTFVPEAEEADIEVVRVPLAQAVAMAERGEITDAKTLIGILLTASRLG